MQFSVFKKEIYRSFFGDLGTWFGSWLLVGLDRSGFGDWSPPLVLSRVGASGSRGGSSTGVSGIPKENDFHFRIALEINSGSLFP